MKSRGLRHIIDSFELKSRPVMTLDPASTAEDQALQADIAADLIRHGVAVHAFNQRDVAGVKEHLEGLARTQRMFKGVVARTQ